MTHYKKSTKRHKALVNKYEMEAKKRNQNKYAWFKILLATFCAMVFNISNIATTLAVTTTPDPEETQEKIEELEKKAKVYRQILEVKQKQKSMLNDQIATFDSQIQQTEGQIETNKRKISDLNSQITDLQKKISEYEITISFQKKMLAGLIESYYTYGQKNVLTSFLSNGDNVGSFMVGKDRISQTGEEVRKMLNSVKELKKKLDDEKSSLENKKKEITSLHIDLEERSSELESSKSQKQQLLTQTKGEESRYQQLLARVEQQKLELLDLDQLYGTGGYSIDDYPKPSKSFYASMDWYYSQRDSRWADVKIGSTNSTMRSWGCAVSAVAMVFKKHGINITPKTLAKASIFSGDLINWPGSWSGSDIELASSVSHGNYNKSRIDSEIKKGNPVIVYIKKSSGGGHYVAIHNKDSNGKYVVHDPYFGPNIYLETSMALVGKGSSTKIDQMIIYN